MSKPISSKSTSRPGISDFDRMSDLARVGLPVVCGLYGACPSTVWRRVKTGQIPSPIKEGGSTKWIVGKLREALSGQPA